jgi:DNA adenine methylase
MNRIIKCIDLFCGGGGFSSGAKKAKSNGQRICDILFGVNHDPVAIESHASNHPDTIHFVEDVRDTGVIQAIKEEVERLPRPFKNYFGSKWVDGFYQRIINYIRPHIFFVEGFVGNGGVFCNLLPCEAAYLNDVNPDVAAAWNALYESDADVYIRNQDFVEFFEKGKALFDQKKTVVYLDPPYPLSTLKSKHRYPCSMQDDEHRVLLRYVKGLVCDVLISTYPNDIYAEELAGWWFVDFEVVTRSGKMATERLYMNYDPATITELHDYRYFGNDFRERERYKRIAKNLAGKFDRMSVIERNAILALSGVQRFLTP